MPDRPILEGGNAAAHSKDVDLKVQMIRELEIVGQVPDLEVIPAILPVIVMGNVTPQTVTIDQPAYRSTDVFSNGVLIAPAAGDVLADTGQLAVGTYDVQAHIQCTDDVETDQRYSIQHRNAANAANLAVWTVLQRGPQLWNIPNQSFAYELAANERLRFVTDRAVTAAHRIVATIFARIR